MRFLKRLGHHVHVVELVILAVIRKRRVGPGATHHLERFEKAWPTFLIADAIATVAVDERAPADAIYQSTAAQVIERRALLRQPQRIGQRQQLDAHTDFDAVRTSGDRRSDHQWRAERRVRAEMKLGEPETINSQFIGDLGESQPLLEGGVLFRTLADIEGAENAEFHAAAGSDSVVRRSGRRAVDDVRYRRLNVADAG